MTLVRHRCRAAADHNVLVDSEWHSSDCRASCTQTQALSHLPQCSRRLSWIFITDDRNWPPNLLKGKEATL